MKREEKLEQAVRAGLKLRKAIVDLTKSMQGPMLSVPRADVQAFDAVIAELSEKETKK